MTKNTETKSIIQPKRALISVSDKSGVIPFAQMLHSIGIEILSTGGTAVALQTANIPVVQVSDYTGFPELMDGRLKTLHPKIHGGILARRDIDKKEMETNDIGKIDMVIVNLYPFAKVVAKAESSHQEIVENIDIGGPALLRAAAKNYAWVSVCSSPEDYAEIEHDMRLYQGVQYQTRHDLAAKCFARVSRYDRMIANYFESSEESTQEFPEKLQLNFRKIINMRYGENPHQAAAFYVPESDSPGWLGKAKRHQGKQLSFNNVADANAAYNCVNEFDQPTCVIIKHATPCGVACAASIDKAYQAAYLTDPVSAFGGVIAFNRTLDMATASAILKNQFVEVLIAPSISKQALEVLSTKANIRVLECEGEASQESPNSPVLLSSGGGLLVQDSDQKLLHQAQTKAVTNKAPNDTEVADLLFAWKVAKHVKSNAIVYAKDQATVGIGAGQMSRVDSATIAVLKAKAAGLQVHGSVMASDAFFPFRDSIDTAAKSGVPAVIQPGGSIRDTEVIEAANEHGIAMLFTGMRHFRH